MKLKIKPGKLSGKIDAISSKSDIHRNLICSAFSDLETNLKISSLSEDVLATADCLESLGACINYDENLGFLKIKPIKVLSDNIVLDCKESGTTLRFLLSIVSSLGVNAEFRCKEQLMKRPITDLLTELKNHGFSYRLNDRGLKVSGKIRGGTYSIKGNISSQFISGILLASPLINEDVEIKILGNSESVGYIEMTIDTMKKFGVSVSRKENGYFIAKNQKYLSPWEVLIEGDWSNSAFWLCAGAICGNIEVRGLSQNSLQPDRKVIDILRKMSAEIKVSGNSFKAMKSSDLEGIEIDVSNIPDLVPILSVVACVSKGRTKLLNAGRLRFKESDRIKSTVSVLKSLGADIRENGDCLEINGMENLEGGKVPSFNDHRIVMSAAIAACVCENEVIIDGFEAADKSYPNFFSDYKMLGGDISVV